MDKAMTQPIDKPLSFFTAIKDIAVFYVEVWPHIIGIVILAAVVQGLVSALIPQNPTIGLAVSILASVVGMFFYAWILYHADSYLMKRHEKAHESLHAAKRRFIPLLGVLVCYIVLVLVIGLFGFGLQLLGRTAGLDLLFATLLGIGFLFLFTLLAFTMPAVILDNFPVLKGFEYSVKLVWGHWWRTFIIILVFVVPVVLLSLAVLLFQTRNIWFITVYELIYHIITYPLMVSLILVLYHDLKARHQAEGFKHIAEPDSHPHP